VHRQRIDRVGRLAGFFAPRSVAVVGASDDSGWTRRVHDNLRATGWTGRFVPVHSRHAHVLGVPAVACLREIDEPVDLAVALTSAARVPEVLRDAAAAKVGGLVVIASGFGEAGAEGRRRQRELTDLATELDVLVLGPNCTGFVNLAERVAPFGGLLPPEPVAGPIGLVMHSGALAAGAIAFATAHNIGLGLVAGVGGEAVISMADVLEHLVDDPGTRVIALFLEGIGEPARFRAAALQALRVGKPIVALTVGRSEAGRRGAATHTGAVAGDAEVTAAVLRQHGVVMVDSLEELLITAGAFAAGAFAAHPEPVRSGRRVVVVSASGGAANLMADRVGAEGLAIAELAPGTVTALRGVLTDGVSVTNPLDVTGAYPATTSAGSGSMQDRATEIVSRDPGADVVLPMLMLPTGVPTDADEARYRELGRLVEASPVPVLPWTYACHDLPPEHARCLRDHRVPVLAGIEFAARAVGHLARWAAAAQRPESPAPPTPIRLTRLPGGTLPEDQARELLAEFGVPVVPAVLASDEDAAVAAADRYGYPVAIKVCSPDITHKSDVGGVALSLNDGNRVRAAYREVLSSVATAAPRASVRGVLVSPMREAGTELLVGVSHDPVFGPVLLLALGGIWVEVLGDTSLRALPVTEADVSEMLGELRGAALLRGRRGGEPADLDAVVAAVLGVASLAGALGDDLVAVEVNPLYISGRCVEALDAVVITDRSPDSTNGWLP
jgi:acyl-CoA synthetase (NDP forming)